MAVKKKTNMIKTIFIPAVVLVLLLVAFRKLANRSRIFPAPKFDTEVAILVTGAGSGLGFDVCRELLDMHDRKLVVYAGVRQESQCDKLRKLPRANPDSRIRCLKMDVANSGQVADAMEEISKNQVPLFGLVNNAAIGMSHNTINKPGAPDTYADDLRKVFDVNVFGLAHLTASAFAMLRKTAAEFGSARIINVSSLMGLVFTPRCGGYCSSKHALEALSADWRFELDKENISVSTIEPGFFASGMCVRQFCEDDPSVCSLTIRHALFDSRPLPRYPCASVFRVPATLVAYVIPLLPDRVIDSVLDAFSPA